MRRRFDRQSATFADAAFVHDEARQRLLERLDYLKITPQVIVDLGAGCGAGAGLLSRRFPGARIIAADSSPAMLAAARRSQTGLPGVVAEATCLPFADNSVDLLLANLVMPWCDPEPLATEAARVLRNDGLLLVSTVGPDTLAEVRQAWRSVDDGVHVHGHLDMHDVADLLGRSGLAEPLTDVDRLTVTYPSVAALVDDLTACGGRNAAPARMRGLTSRRRWQQFASALDGFRQDGRIGISVELIFAQAWGQERPTPTGEVSIPIGRIGRR